MSQENEGLYSPPRPIERYTPWYKENRDITKNNQKLIDQWEKNGVRQSTLVTPVVDEDNWAISKNTIIGLPFQVPYSCVNTISSHCLELKKGSDTVEDCMELCKKDPYCSYGNYIKMKGKTYCLPYQRPLPDFNIHRAIWSSFAGYQGKNIESTSFVDMTEYPKWGDLDYSIFLGDKLAIQPVGLDIYLGSNIKNEVVFKPSRTEIQLMTQAIGTTAVSKIINYRDVLINIFGTYSIVKEQVKDDGKTTNFKPTMKDALTIPINENIQNTPESRLHHEMDWYDGLGAQQNWSNTFVIICLNKRPGKVVTYDDEFVFIVNGLYLCTDGTHELVRSSKELNDDIDAAYRKNVRPTYTYKFKCIPLFNVSYCDNKIDIDLAAISQEKNTDAEWSKNSLYRCLQIPLDKCTRIGDTFYYIKTLESPKDGTQDQLLINDDHDKPPGVILNNGIQNSKYLQDLKNIRADNAAAVKSGRYPSKLPLRTIKFPVYRAKWCLGVCRGNGAVQYTNQVSLKNPEKSKNLIIDQTIIIISTIVLSFTIMILLK